MSSWYDPFGLTDDNYKDPSKSAMPYLEKIPGAIQPYYQPYMEAGDEALGDLQSQFRMLLNDPTFMMTQIGNSYTASPGYQYNVNQATNAANNAAAAGGYLGSPAEQENLTKSISGLAAQDYDKYMDQALSQYGLGMKTADSINDMGYRANTGYANELSDVYKSEANLAYAGTQGQNVNSGARNNQLLKLLGVGAGYAMGGPMGAYAGGSLMGS